MIKKIIRWLLVLIIITGITFLGFYNFWFLRLPERNIPFLDKVYVSPANGKVIAIKPWYQDSLVITKGMLGAIKILTEDLGKQGKMLSIEMNLQNVHYQRAPIRGKVLKQIYTRGEFNNALVQVNEYGMRFENEHNTILFESNSGTKFKVVQIAGFLARRIEAYIEPGKEVQQGDVIGLIKMGSQVSVIFPENVEILAKEGDIVVEGESPIARETY